MKIKYRDHRFNGPTKEWLDAALQFVEEEFEGRGLPITVRRTYYRFRDLGLFVIPVIPDNPTEEEKRAVAKASKAVLQKLSNLLVNARESGLVDWYAITDEGRDPEFPLVFESAAARVQAAIDNFALDKWVTQPSYLECWFEKLGHAANVRNALEGLQVPLQVGKGYGSATALQAASLRFLAQAGEGKRCHIVYVGDHDASGADIDRYIAEKLAEYRAQVTVERVAVTKEQAERLNLNPELVNERDIRAESYIAKFGHRTWELDAMPATTWEAVLRKCVEAKIDADAWGEAEALEDNEKTRLAGFAAGMEG